MEKEIFITEININKVRNLEKVQIVISDKERKHLILTGKNGSGKTSVLEAIKTFLERGIEHNFLFKIVSYKESIKNINRRILELQERLKTALNEDEIKIESIINTSEKEKTHFEEMINAFENTQLFFSDVSSLLQEYGTNHFLLAYFDAKRNSAQNTQQPFFDKVNGLKKIDFKSKYLIGEKIGNLLVQHLLNLYVDLIESEKYKETATVTKIENWFQNFELSLQNILGDVDLKLAYNRQERTYKLKLGNGLTVDFNELSDGYSSILIIVAELMMRMEAMNARNYDLQGIVLIDEIETHLHIDLQKKILPFLTTFFPKIQFIVTTHSPFVLNSVANSVVFDLEKQIRMDDAYLYSAAGIVEGYFEDDAYSLNPKQLEDELNEYEILIQKPNLTDDENEEVLNLRRKFKNIPENMAIDIVLRFEQAEINRLTLKK